VLAFGNNSFKKSKEWSNLHGRHVVLKGKFIAYNDLSDAENSVERELNRKYFDGQIIFNQCLNDFVFYPTEISLAEH